MIRIIASNVNFAIQNIDDSLASTLVSESDIAEVAQTMQGNPIEAAIEISIVQVVSPNRLEYAFFRSVFSNHDGCPGQRPCFGDYTSIRLAFRSEVSGARSSLKGL